MKRAVFLDRDGTLIEDGDYLADPARVRVLPGVPQALGALREAGFLLVVVTNQSGIGRGLLTEADHRAVTRRMLDLLRVPLDGLYHCPHRPEDGCECRKPAPGMLLAAARDLGIDLAASYAVGDAERDVAAGLAAGCRAVLLGPGPAPAGARVAEDLAAAVREILAW